MICRKNHSVGLMYVSPSQETYRKIYGRHAVVTRLGDLNLIHLDRPDPGAIRRRIEEMHRRKSIERFLEDDCPLCRPPRDIIFHGT